MNPYYEKDGIRVLTRMYEACGEGSDLPTIHVCGLEEWRKRQLCESGWPDGRPTLEEFWSNTYEGLASLKKELATP